MRKLKYHEQKLLKKVDFINWEIDNNEQILKIMCRFNLRKREEYIAYKQLVAEVRQLAEKLKELDTNDKFRNVNVIRLVEKLYLMGVIPTNRNFAEIDKLCVSSFCRRRLPVVMQKLNMSETLQIATQRVEHGHVKVGTELVTDPAFLVTRRSQDLITWTENSKIKRHIAAYNEELDDFDLMD
ncbi:U3 small nucleolar ribonucleoprotein protein IMP3-like [Symsagittifera roscoffensis]|uniref:U3 small nucleolar ribonucleoprotein protein IMP3-like n=1 Tax=Symsagittifera roscoffensis TaxID=84072 RepID=UPI00307B2B7F